MHSYFLLSLNTEYWRTPKSDFSCKCEVRIYLLTLFSCSRYGLRNSVLPKCVHKPLSPGPWLFLVTKALKKGKKIPQSPPLPSPRLQVPSLQDGSLTPSRLTERHLEYLFGSLMLCINPREEVAQEGISWISAHLTHLPHSLLCLQPKEGTLSRLDDRYYSRVSSSEYSKLN